MAGQFSFVYNNMKTAMFTGGFDLTAAVIKARLVNTTVNYPSPNPTHVFMSSVPKYLNSTDQTLGTKSVSQTQAGGNNLKSVVAFDAADLTFPALAVDAGKPVDALCIYKFGTNDADSLPLWFVFGFTPLTPANAQITVTWANTVNRLLANAS